MRHGLLAFAVAATAAAGPGLAHAQRPDKPDKAAAPDDEDEHEDGVVGIPPGFERFELSDLTFTMRDDSFSAITTDAADPLTAYVGTNQGRFYKTTDGGRTWSESTVISEQGRLWQTPGSSIFFGAIRSSGGGASSADLVGSGGSPIETGHVPGSLHRLPSPVAPTNPLETESGVSVGGGVSALGVGLSSRSPRLSILTGSRGRPVPTLNRVRFLLGGSLRGTTIFNISVDPTDRKHLFAATDNGLYVSRDAGQSWSRSFAGLTSGERVILRIAIRPGEPKLMILGTRNGAYTSVDGGENWSKSTTVGGSINHVAFDSKDPNFIYLATSGGVLRSNDGGRNFIQVFYSTFPAEGDVRSIVIDPFDPDTGYIGTMQGAFVTHKLRSAKQTDWAALQSIRTALPHMNVCSRHKGHIYALTSIELPTISYGADPPESAIVESWDGGKTWRRVFTGQSAGSARHFTVDAKDPDVLWIAWSKALYKVERAKGKAFAGAGTADELNIDGPSLGAVILAALKNNGIELDEYKNKLDGAKSKNWLPRVITVTGTAQQWSTGGIMDDAQFTASRYYQIGDAAEWRVMVWGSWALPDIVYTPDSVPLLRQRVNQLNDELRGQLIETMQRHYGELLRIRALLDGEQLDLATRVIYRLRIEQLEAIVDLTTGGYLSRWQKQHRRTGSK